MNVPEIEAIVRKMSSNDITYFREEVLGLGRQEFAQRTGCSYRSVYRWETEKRPISHLSALAIAIEFRAELERICEDPQLRLPFQSYEIVGKG